jgi:uncharacterized protein (DUF58 family)
MDLSWDPFRRVHIRIPCEKGPYALPRGTYRVTGFRLILTDWAGFFAYSIGGTAPVQVTVYPSPQARISGMPTSSIQAPERQSLLSFLKNQDFFEVRPYYPGDDPRRIHWKMLARHEELFIREGSSLSPSRKSALLIVDAPPPVHFRRLQRVKSFVEVDQILRVLAGLLDSLSEEGLQVSGLFPGDTGVADLGKLSLRDRQNLLASLPPEPLERGSWTNRGSVGILYYFSTGTPSSDSLALMEREYPQAVRILILPSSQFRGDTREGWLFVKA